MERNLALELVRVTEAAALASARWMGKGDSEAAIRAASEAVTIVMGSVKMKGRIVIGDPALAAKSVHAGAKGDIPEVDIAVDALQSVESVALGRPYAISTIAVSNPKSFLTPPVPYMNKIAVGPDAAGSVDIRKSPLDNLVNIAAAKRCYVRISPCAFWRATAIMRSSTKCAPRGRASCWCPTATSPPCWPRRCRRVVWTW
jgi:fructose-1,6-bisphosphatase II